MNPLKDLIFIFFSVKRETTFLLQTKLQGHPHISLSVSPRLARSLVVCYDDASIAVSCCFHNDHLESRAQKSRRREKKQNLIQTIMKNIYFNIFESEQNQNKRIDWGRFSNDQSVVLSFQAKSDKSKLAKLSWLAPQNRTNGRTGRE